MPETESSTEGNVKQVLAWASVAYAGGFVTVTLHTWRLGLPVIELLHPIYVWIGLPLALVAFFFEHIVRAFRKRSSDLAAEIRGGWSQVTTPIFQDGLKIAANVVGILKALPLNWLFSGPVIRMAESLLPKLEQLEAQAKAHNRQLHERTAKYVRRVLGFFRVLSAVFGALNLVSYAVLICLGVALYVWEVYPRIPQSLGGGKPSTVTLIAERTALPRNVTPKLQSPGSIVASAEKETVSLPVTLLYLTKNSYFVQTMSGARISVKADAVKSVVWMQPAAPLLPNKTNSADVKSRAAD